MAIRIPDFNAETTGNLAVGYTLGAACSKPANTASVTAFWFKNRDFLMEQNVSQHVILARASGASGGNDAYIGISRDCTTLRMSLRNGGTVQLAATNLTGLEYGKTYLVLLAARNGWVHLIACEPGGVPLTVSVVNTTLFSLAMTTTPLWQSVTYATSTTARLWYGPIEELNFWYGAFPETSDGVPDAALVQAIANGTQDLDTLHTLLTADGGTAPAHRRRYRMQDETDLSSTVVGPPVVDLTPMNISRPNGAAIYPSGPLRPGRITPAYTRDCVSQVVFTTPGNPTSATAQIKVEGGSYNGLPTMDKMQARLLDESRTVVRDWIDLTTTAPSSGAGTWEASDGFLDVPMQASFLTREFRALDATGAVIAGPVSGYGLSGAGFHIIGQAQSQLLTTVVSAAGYALPSGCRFLVALQEGNEFVPGDPELGEPDKPAVPYKMKSYMPRPVFTAGFGARVGPRIMAAEINALYPGVPVQFTNLSLGGTSLAMYSDYDVPGTPGQMAGRWAGMKEQFGIVQPFILMFFGHSSGTSGYYNQLAAVVAWSQAQFGTPVRYMHVPVSRYRGAGTGTTFTATRNSREGAREFVLDNPGGMHWWMYSQSNIFTYYGSTSGVENPLVTSNPHSEGTGLYGAARIGSLMGQGLLMASRAVVDVPVGLVGAEVVSPAQVKLVFGPINTG